MRLFSRKPKLGPGPFECANCPKNNNADKGRWCPGWQVFPVVVTDVNGAETEQVREACYLQSMPVIWGRIETRLNVLTHTISKHNEDVDNQFAAVKELTAWFAWFQQTISQITEAKKEQEQVDSIEDKRGEGSLNMNIPQQEKAHAANNR